MTEAAASADIVEAFWDKQVEIAGEMPPGSAWWNTPHLIRHINKIVCGEPIDGIHAGFHRRINQLVADMPRPRKAVSVGCGVGTKEMDLMLGGEIDTFECYETSGATVEISRSIAKERGLDNRFTIHHADAFLACTATDFDLVYWNNSLHHMMDAKAAVQWSWDRLRNGGLFAIDDYVGATYNQHSPELVAWGTELMASLPERLRRHWNGVDVLPPFCGRVDLQYIIELDPSECADSASILPAIGKRFREHQIIKTGGAAYFYAMQHIFHNFTSETDLAFLTTILNADLEITHRTETQYAVVFAFKKLGPLAAIWPNKRKRS
jgi:SAM-dependent methyltransferase